MAKETIEYKNWSKHTCLVARQPGGTLYTIVIKGQELVSRSKVLSRAKALDEIGVQRVRIDGRCRRIAKFYERKDAMLPCNIIGNMDSKQVHYDVEEGVIYINPKFQNEIIDGQTRVWGFDPQFNESNVDFDVILTFFVDADDKTRALQFFKINKEQKKINPSLGFDLLEVIADDTQETTISQIVKSLNVDADSPFRGIIKIKEGVEGRISLATMVDKIKKFVKTPMGLKFIEEDSDFEIKEAALLETLKAYFNAIKKQFPEEWDDSECILAKSLGYGAFIELLPEVLTEFVNKNGYKKAAAEDFEKILELMNSFDFKDPLVSSLGGEKGQKTLAKMMRRELNLGTF